MHGTVIICTKITFMKTSATHMARYKCCKWCCQI